LNFPYLTKARDGLSYALLAWVLILSAAEGRAQLWQTWTTADGLVDNQVFGGVFQTRDGALWFATREGVSRYDGGWQTFSEDDGLSHNDVYCIFEDRDAVIWIGTRGSLTRIDGDSTYTFPPDSLGISSRVHDIEQTANGDIWIATANGPRVFDGRTWRKITFEDGIVSDESQGLVLARDGALWLATYYGVGRFDGSVWENFTSDDLYELYNIQDGMQTTDGSIWFYSRNGGVIRYRDSEWQRFTRDDGLGDNWVSGMFEADGAVWFATDRGLSRFDGETWTTLTEADGLADDEVHGALVSPSGIVWLATNSGISQYNGLLWHRYGVADGLPDDLVRGIAEDVRGRLWAGTLSGAARFDGRNWQTFSRADGLVSDNVAAIRRLSDDALWFATDGGVSRFDGETWINYTTADGLAADAVRDIYEADDGSIWFATDGGVTRYDGNTFETFTSENTDYGLGNNLTLALGQSADGAMWFAGFATVGKSLTTRWGGGNDWVPYWLGESVKENQVVSMLRARDGGLWFGTWGGAWRFAGGDPLVDASWQLHTQDDGLSNSSVSSMDQAADGAMWFGTAEGVTSFHDGLWQRFDPGSGLLDGINRIYVANDDAVWIGTESGLVRFVRPQTPVAVAVVTNPPPRHYGSDRYFFEVSGRERGAGLEPLLSFACTPSDREPRAGDWSAFASFPGIEIADLENGDWTFHARARDRFGNISAEPSTTAFTIDLTPPTVIIAEPEGTIFGRVAITGSIFDNSSTPDLDDFRLEYARVAHDPSWESTRIHDQVSEPVIDGLLGWWDTDGLSGSYLLRLSAEDALGHRSAYQVEVEIVAAAEKIDPRFGGRVGGEGNEVVLYVPPNGIEHNSELTVSPLPASELPVAAAADMRFAGKAYRLEPQELMLNRPATFSIRLDSESTAGDLLRPALFFWSDTDQQWLRVGGRLVGEPSRLSAAIDRFGLYAVFLAPVSEGLATLSGLACQPRLISPRGGGFAAAMDISFDLGGSTPTSVRVFDMVGRVVRSLIQDETLFQGSNTTSWDGRDEADRIVSDGAYLVMVDTGGQRISQVVTVIDGGR